MKRELALLPDNSVIQKAVLQMLAGLIMIVMMMMTIIIVIMIVIVIHHLLLECIILPPIIGKIIQKYCK